VRGTLVIGYGNPLRGDDGIGWHVIQALEARPASGEREGAALDLLACHQLLPELAEPISKASHVIFIDARVDGVPGAVIEEPLEPSSTAATSLTHDFDAPTLLALARVLYGHCPPATLLSIPAASFDYTDKLSPPVQEALPTIIQRARELVRTRPA
jgi:hydrogenase maturation protease